MINFCFLLLSFCLTYIGLGVLAIAMPRHRYQISLLRHSSSEAPVLYKLFAVLSLILSLISLTSVYSPGISFIFWIGLVTIACLLLTLGLSYFPDKILTTVKLSSMMAILSAMACFTSL